MTMIGEWVQLALLTAALVAGLRWLMRRWLREGRGR